MTTQGGSYSWNATCDVCGFQYKANELRKRWDGLMVCEADFETRHPMDFYRVKNDHHQLPFVRQDPLPVTGFLPASGLTTYENTIQPPSVYAVGSKFTVGTADRTLVGARVGVDVSPITLAFLTAPLTVKLWTDAGVLLKTWSVSDFRAPPGVNGEATWAFARLMPGYTLSASTAYRISVLVPADRGIVTSSAQTSVQSYMTYNASYYSSADIFPNTLLATTQATPHLDVITRSDN